MQFSLRGGEELRRLRVGNLSQIVSSVDACGVPCLIYTEDVSKARQGGIKSISQPPKRVHSYHNENDHKQCLPCLFSLYLSKRPANVTTDALFLTPKDNKSTGDWYKNMPYGKNSLSNVVKVIMSGFDGHFTNHSLRRSSITRLFQSDFDEDLIRSHSGHKSLAILHYKEPSTEQLQNVSQNIYASKEPPECGSSNVSNNAAFVPKASEPLESIAMVSESTPECGSANDFNKLSVSVQPSSEMSNSFVSKETPECGDIMSVSAPKSGNKNDSNNADLEMCMKINEEHRQVEEKKRSAGEVMSGAFSGSFTNCSFEIHFHMLI
jgi:hypothetical protein